MHLRRLTYLLLVIIGLGFGQISYAQINDSKLVTGLSSDYIAVTSSFTGSDITIFGTVENLKSDVKYDIVIVVEGPEKTATVRQKERVAGIWINTQALEIPFAPTSLYVLSSGALETIASEEVVSLHQLNIASRLPVSSNTARNVDFKSAFIRLQSKNGLYEINEKGVVFLSENLFRAQVKVPASIPVGTHQIDIFFLQDGVVKAIDRQTLVIEKQGLEEVAHSLAYDYSFLYGILAVIMAFVMGWGASVIFRKD